MRNHPRRAIAALATLAVGIALAQVGIIVPSAQASTVPPWEPNVHQTYGSVGSLTLYNAAGQRVTSGSAASHPFVTYAVAGGTTTDVAPLNKAQLSIATPDGTNLTYNWASDVLSSNTYYPNASDPAVVRAGGANTPYSTSTSSDFSLNDYIGEFPNAQTGPEAGLYELRLITNSTHQMSLGKYFSADILVTGSGASATWQQVYPAVSVAQATTTTLSASPVGTAVAGSPVSLSATLSPSAAAGTVQFFDGSSSLGSAAVIGGVATLPPTSALTAGPHAFKAVFTPTDPTAYQASTSSTSSYSVTAAPADYTALSPCRVFNTGHGGVSGCSNAPNIGAVAKVGTGKTLVVQVAGVGGVPLTGATAVVLNVTVNGATGPTTVTAYPDGTSRPLESNVSAQSAGAVPSLVTVALGADGKVDFYNSGGAAYIIADLAGYYEPAVGVTYNPLTPCRVFSTGHGGVSGCAGAPNIGLPAPIGAGKFIRIKVAGVGGVPATGATAVVLNVTAVGATKGTYVTVWPDGVQQPVVSNLNVNSGAPVPNLAIVAIGTGGYVDFYNAVGSVNVIADLAGYYGGTVGSAFVVSTPACRVFNTQTGTTGATCASSPAVAKAPLGAAATLRVPITNVAGVPSTATGVAMSVTSVGATKGTYLTVWPSSATQPVVSNLNVGSASPISNMAQVSLGTAGTLDFYNAVGATNVTGDLEGYFVPSA